MQSEPIQNTSKQAMIDVRNVSKRYGKNTVLSNINKGHYGAD